MMECPFYYLLVCLRLLPEWETAGTDTTLHFVAVDLCLRILLGPFCQLAHYILNKLSDTIYWKSPNSILSMSGHEIYIFLEKNG